jgi:diaminopimelate decarboxylase
MLKEYNKYLEYKNNKLYLERISLEFLAKKFGTPLYFYSISYVKDKIKEYKKAFPDALICYAVKANFNSEILKIIKNEGLGVDIVSGGELYVSLLAGIEPQKIVYAGVGKTEKEIMEAIKADILMFNVESRMELDVLNNLAKKFKKKVRIAIRINPDVNPKTHPYIATGMKKVSLA